MGNETVMISEADQYLFAQGTHYEIYKKLGAHFSVENGVKGVFFAVWAPHAAAVHVVGEFNDWNEDSHSMGKIDPGEIFTLFVPGVHENTLYKYMITTQTGEKLFKADPFANFAEIRPGTASRITDLSGFPWEDDKWLAKREKTDVQSQPMCIYECHIGSWMKHPDGTEDGFYTYREFADKLSEYLQEMKYTHVELLGIAEHPYDGSWGYQVTGYYAPTSRHGSPKDFMYLVNKMHEIGVGVILDWVPAHFTTDAHGLAGFDGECLFEHPDPRLGEHPEWGTKIFNYEKKEVTNFLIANVLFWLREFHIDGVRVDAVASMLYLDYGKEEGQWCPNKYGDNKNLEAIEFIKHLNSVVRGTYPGFMTIAEESTTWPMVTGRLEDGGLGFTFKWNMGWMHDFCEYMKLDPYFRKDNHYSMSFAMTYNESENYVLPISHDEVVHLKCSMVNKMPGYHTDKYANLRVGYTYMFGHAGKKLLFMGQDFGQEREWNEKRELDWFLLKETLNSGLKSYVSELLKLYRKYPCMYAIDNSWKGFEWLDADDKERCTYSFVRKTDDGKNSLLFVLNMTPMCWQGFRIGVWAKTKYKLLLNSEEERFGGNGDKLPAMIEADEIPQNGKKYSLSLDLGPYMAAVFVF
ncbi:MAG TPA: 1,4-alpha-glucan branching protein GlgB [Lachnospiraceae bacterium]|nr:1,4-alpha-glucan branching protein GlgB [Lachnospiraceae bacterium]